MKKEPKVSVIVPVYNTEKYVVDCIESVKQQTFAEWELILIDDGSTDKSYSICKKYAEKDQRIRLYQQENKGQGVARNYALSICYGEYITFLDSDDIVHERILEDLVKVCEENNADIAMARIDAFVSKPQSKNDDVIVQKEYVKNFFDSFVMERNYQNHMVTSKLYKKSLISDICFPEYRAIEDEFFLTEVYVKVIKVVTINNIRYFYRQTKSSTMRGGFNPNRALIVNALLERSSVCRNAKKEYLANIVEGQCLLECMDWWNKFNQNKEYKKANDMRRIFISIYRSGMKSDMLSWKDSIRIRCFYINPYLYCGLIKVVGRR